jgi:hypothetical protein
MKRLFLAALVVFALCAPAHAVDEWGDGVCETSATAGTGTLNLGGVPSTGGWVTFASQITSGASVPYVITQGSGATREWETGWGTFTDGSPDTLTRVADWSSDGSGAELTLTGDSIACISVISSLYDSFRRVGKQTVPVMAAAMKGNATSPASCGDGYDSGSNDLTAVVCAFDTGGTEERADFQIPMPKSWNEGTFTFIPISTCTGCSAAQTIQYELACVAISHDDPLNATMGSAQTSSVTVTATNDSLVGAESSAITCAGTPAEGDLVAFRISRDTSVDNAAGDALLLGIKLFFTSNAANDL